MRLELRLHAGTLAWTAVFAAFTVLLAGTIMDFLILLAPLRAATAWYRYGRNQDDQRELLRAGAGISRADAARARISLVAVDGLIHVAAALVGAVIAIGIHDYELTVSAAYPSIGHLPSSPAELIMLQSGPWGIAALALTAIFLGRRYIQGRVTRRDLLGSVLVHLGSTIVIALAMLGPRRVIDAVLPATADGARDLAEVLLGMVLCAIALLVLWYRGRTWVLSLDSSKGRRLS